MNTAAWTGIRRRVGDNSATRGFLPQGNDKHNRKQHGPGDQNAQRAGVTRTVFRGMRHYLVHKRRAVQRQQKIRHKDEIPPSHTISIREPRICQRAQPICGWLPPTS